jgi:purine nucleoside phosphorylase
MVERMASTSLYERAEHANRIIRSRITVEPRIAVVLGSGLGGFADDFDDLCVPLRKGTQVDW